MGYISSLKSPKKEEEEEEEEVEKGSVKGVAIWDDFEAFLELCDEQKSPLQENNIVYGGPLDWEWMDHFFDDHFSLSQTNDDQAAALDRVVPKACSSDDGDGVMKKKKVSLNLNLNYEEVLEAWSGRGSLWTATAAAAASSSSSLSNPTLATYMGEVPRMEEERTRRILRYKEKRHTRLFSKKIRYQVRKLNAEKRPRIKGRFVKTVS